jgi:hypothetical protein
MNKKIHFYSNLFAWGLIIFLIGNHVFGWTTPVQIPPEGNIELETGVTPAGSTGHIQFNNNGNLGADSNLFWDNVNKYLGIGTVNPEAKLEIQGSEGGSLKFTTDVEASGLLEVEGKIDITGDLIVNGENITKNDWGFKEGPLSFVSDYINTWNNQGDYGDSIDCVSSANGCTILQDGTYKIRCVQRSNATGSVYVGVALNGSRTTLESRVDAMWNHDHAEVSGEYTESNFIGTLSSGDFITCGPVSANSSKLQYGTNSYRGTISIQRL